MVCWTKTGSKQLQVKTRQENHKRPRLFVYALREKSFDMPDYFVFVARRLGGRTDFIVLPKSYLARLKEKEDVKLVRQGYCRVNL